MTIVSDNVLRHILRKHRDTTRLMGVRDIEELRKIIISVIKEPDEAYMDKFDTKYFLKKIDELYVNTIVVEDSVKTAYLISTKSYKRFRERKWVQRLF
ncbi:MAG: hypothetical protein QXR97_07130 [Thermoproteota archaeon]